MGFIGEYSLQEIAESLVAWHTVYNTNLQIISDKLEARWFPLVYTVADLAASVSTVAVPLGNDPQFSQIVVPFDAHIVGLSAFMSATPTGGSALFGASYDGAGVGFELTIDNTKQYDISTQAEGTDEITPNHRVGVLYTTASLNPAGSLDATIVLWLVGEDI